MYGIMTELYSEIIISIEVALIKSASRRCQEWQSAVSAERALFSDITYPTQTARQTEHGNPISVR